MANISACTETMKASKADLGEASGVSQSAQQAIPMWRIYMIALIELAAVGALATPLAVSLSLKVISIVPASQKESALGVVTAVGALAALFANPIFGYLSDRTRSKFGRRRPWLVFGAVAGLASAVVLAIAPNVPVLTIGWVLTQVSYNATLAALYGLLADQVPESQRSRASGIFGAFGFIGIVPAMIFAALFAKNLPVVLLGMPIVSLVVIVVVAALIRDPKAEVADENQNFVKRVFGPFMFNPAAVKLFTLAWIQRATFQFGYTIVGTFGLFYLIVRLGMEATHAASLASMATIVGAALNFIAAMVFGYVAARRGNYLFAILSAAVLLIVSLLLKAFTEELSVFWISTLIGGFALGLYYAVDLAVAMRTLPPGEEGKYLGIFNVAKTLPQSLAPALAPLLFLVAGSDPVTGNEKNYMALYLVGAAVVALSLLTLPGLKSVLRRDRYEQSRLTQDVIIDDLKQSAPVTPEGRV